MRQLLLLLFALPTLAISAQACDDVQACIVASNNNNGSYLFENCSTPIANGQFVWNFGDGSSETGVVVDHFYAQPGTYAVCLTMYWQNCVDSTCTAIIVQDTDPCDGLSADFYYSGANDGLNFGHPIVNLDWTYVWDFGDGTTAFGPSPYHIYPSPGTYQTCLTVSIWDPISQDSCFVDHCETIAIGGEPCDFLQACYVPTQISGTNVFFNNCTPNEPGTLFTWLFGDGSTSNDLAPTHTYATEGSYEVCLVAEWQNCFDSTCTYITVGQSNPCDDFAVSLAWNEGGNATYFFNATSNRPNASFTWYFGDDTQATGAAAQHVFNDPGEYEVCVLGALYDPISGDTCLVEDCIAITIGNTMGCDSFTTWFDVEYGNAAVFFEAHTSVNVDGYVWDFGDGTDGYESEETHYFEPPGPYTVCLSTYYWNPNTQDSCWSTSCQVVDPLGPNGVADLNAEDLFTIYPQPATNVITIDCATPRTEAIVELFNMDGRLEQQERITALPHQLDVSQLTPAVHLMRIQLDGVRYNYRVVIQ